MIVHTWHSIGEMGEAVHHAEDVYEAFAPLGPDQADKVNHNMLAGH